MLAGNWLEEVTEAGTERAVVDGAAALEHTAERGGMAWRRASGYNSSALVEADVGPHKRLAGAVLRMRTDGRDVRGCRGPGR